MTAPSDRNARVQEVLDMARNIGPIGAFAPEQDQQKLLEMAKGLADYSDPNPASEPLDGEHRLVYSSSKGASAGILFGPIHGAVTQTFFNQGKNFINSVELGPLKLSLRAERQFVNEQTNKVVFLETSVTLFGQTVVKKEIGGGGIWNYIFCGTIQDIDGKSKVLRVLEAPNLFIILS